ncbi:hypothetical protein [Sphingomonas faeni]|uniref:hypothetical protein n=1 Tax=Sphingomonas faeni TaxID=185950 RepID=UPI0020C7AE55|nr:hypothetical protein [Sphingomonas faeni]MCP8893006.1 hypothetical protein [Sphingomonas faeni]
MVSRFEAAAVCVYLNDLLAADPVFMNAIVSHRPECNAALAEHPTFQVGMIDGTYCAGLIGLLNGLLGKHETGPHAGHGLIYGRFVDDQVIGFGLVGVASGERA